MIMNSSYLLVSDSNVWVLGGFSFILAQKINDGNMEINHTPTFIIEPEFFLHQVDNLKKIRYYYFRKFRVNIKKENDYDIKSDNTKNIRRT